MKSNYIICLDNGHGADTKGKCSPDQQVKEYSYTREIVQILSDKLKENDYNIFIVTPESNDISLKERVARVNKTYKDNNSYQIKIKVEYQKDLKYPTEIELKLIHKDKKLYIIEVK